MLLNCHSFYSLHFGVLSILELIARCKETGYNTIVLTEINSVTSSFQFYTECLKQGLKPVCGVEFRDGNDFLYVAIAKNPLGWANICEHLSSLSRKSSLALPKRSPIWNNVYSIYLTPPCELASLRENEFVGVRPENIPRLKNSYLYSRKDKLVVFSPITFNNTEGFHTHKILRCIDRNIVWSQLDSTMHSKSSEVPIPISELKNRYKEYPEILENTERLINSCNISLETGSKVNRQVFTTDRESDADLLRKLSLKGCKERYGTNEKAKLRTLAELDVIFKGNYSAYFLINWDIVRYARSMNYRYVGRGSGANSIVAYNLGITDVDPLELDLYFERFLNPHRSSPPDFDIDFSWDERDDVIDYVFKRYGKGYVGLLATYNTFKGKSIIRELGKVLGLPKKSIDMLIRRPSNRDSHHPYADWIYKTGKKLEGLPNYLSIHAGGIIISQEPLYNHTALQMMPKGFPIVQFDMYGAEDLGFHKFDVLSQRGLGHIKDSMTLIKKNKGIDVDIDEIEQIKLDEKVRNQLKSKSCIGCFYIESPAMRGLLAKIKCDNYIHLVAASSIIRPGVAKSGMMREFIFRFHNPDSYTHIHKVFEEHLGETFGVMVYQEDVMKIIHHFSNLGLDESDVLRRIMTGKKKNSDTFEALKSKYFKNCAVLGYTKELSQEVWRQIESFSGYSFCKAHSASYAVESFQSLYLKAYYPLEFITAVINNFGGFYSTEVYFHEARMSGGKVEPPCINNSSFLTDIYDDKIYVGFKHIQSLESDLISRIVAERHKGGEFYNLRDFTERVNIGIEQLELLIRIGSFRFTGLSKYQLMWQKSSMDLKDKRERSKSMLFSDVPHEDFIPDLQDGKYDQVFDEMEIIGYPLCSPTILLDHMMDNAVTVANLDDSVGMTVWIYGYYIAEKHVTTVNRKHMKFGTFIDVDGVFFDTTHFPKIVDRYPLSGKGWYLIKGKVVSDFDFMTIDVISLERQRIVRDERYPNTDKKPLVFVV